MNFKKLSDMNINDVTNKDTFSKLSELFNKSGVKDWVMDSESGGVKLLINFINRSNNPNPTYQKEGDSGFDLGAHIPETIILKPFERVLISTGLYFQIPIDFELQIRPRSGLALKNGITVLNSPGTVDSGYRAEIKVLLINLGTEPFEIKNGDRIAQGVIAPVQTNKTTIFKQVNSLESSDRNTGGFGSTGK